MNKVKHFTEKKLIIEEKSGFEIAPSPQLSNHNLNSMVFKPIPTKGEHTSTVINIIPQLYLIMKVLNELGFELIEIQKVVQDNLKTLAKL